jgi:hypothetical protein
MRDLTPSEIASASPPPSTRAASESEEETETEAGDERMPGVGGDEAANDGDKRMKRSHDDAVGMDLDS